MILLSRFIEYNNIGTQSNLGNRLSGRANLSEGPPLWYGIYYIIIILYAVYCRRRELIFQTEKYYIVMPNGIVHFGAGRPTE